MYGYQGRVIAAVTFDQAKWLEFYQRQIERAAPFPPPFPTVDRRPDGSVRCRPTSPTPSVPTHGPTVTLSGYSPTDRGGRSPRAHGRAGRRATLATRP